MAELTTSDTTATDPSSCCAPDHQASCCAPTDKAECCNPSHSDGCGCAAGEALAWEP
jgi:arsenite methyltransferase